MCQTHKLHYAIILGKVVFKSKVNAAELAAVLKAQISRLSFICTCNYIFIRTLYNRFSCYKIFIKTTSPTENKSSISRGPSVLV